ncbi:MAG: hypothetical protein MJ007_02070 [Paludibacteraceae bacterium]|nr:hypothetical protein [Paludibacteraceae bacterium]
MNRKQRAIANLDKLAQKRRKLLDLKEASEFVVPYVYTTVVMALKDMTDMSDDDITDIIGESQRLWFTEDWTDSPIQVCYERTGIRLANLEEYEKNKDLWEV